MPKKQTTQKRTLAEAKQEATKIVERIFNEGSEQQAVILLEGITSAINLMSWLSEMQERKEKAENEEEEQNEGNIQEG